MPIPGYKAFTMASALFADLFPRRAKVIDGDDKEIVRIDQALQEAYALGEDAANDICNLRMVEQPKSATITTAGALPTIADQRRAEIEACPEFVRVYIMGLEAAASELERFRTLYESILGPMLTRCRAAQDAQHGGPKHDDCHTPGDWAEYIREFAGRAEYQGQFKDNADSIGRYQKYMIDVAGLAIAAVLSSQRKVRGESA